MHTYCATNTKVCRRTSNSSSTSSSSSSCTDSCSSCAVSTCNYNKVLGSKVNFLAYSSPYVEVFFWTPKVSQLIHRLLMPGMHSSRFCVKNIAHNTLRFLRAKSTASNPRLLANGFLAPKYIKRSPSDSFKVMVWYKRSPLTKQQEDSL